MNVYKKKICLKNNEKLGEAANLEINKLPYY